jgi:hypothetical protein
MRLPHHRPPRPSYTQKVTVRKVTDADLTNLYRTEQRRRIAAAESAGLSPKAPVATVTAPHGPPGGDEVA